MSLALQSQQRGTALQRSERPAPPRRVDERGLDFAYRATCARRDCERRQHLVRRRNLTNPVWNGRAL
ncbi:MAG: hypothetical protein ACK2UX_12515 [Anaerolineae bacterium]|jgi:hypothetical protein